MSLTQGAIPTYSIKSVLLRLPNWLGDSVMISPAFEWLKKSFVNADFTLVGTKASCGIYERDERVKRIVIDTSKSAKCRIYATRKLAKEIGIHDLAISFTNTFFSALLLYWSKSKVRIGYAKNARSFLLTHALPLHKYDWQGNIKHQVCLYLELIASLESVQKQAYETYKNALDDKSGGNFLPKDTLKLQEQLAHIQNLQDCIDSASQMQFQLDLLPILSTMPLQLIASALTLPTQSYTIGINPGAAFGSAKCWEKSYFITIIEYFLTCSYDVYLFGSSESSRTNAQIAESIANHPNIGFFHDLTDKTNLSQLIDYIAAMNVFITNDSGPMHIAAALKVPMVAIFGPTNIKETAPYAPKPLHSLPLMPTGFKDTKNIQSPEIILEDSTMQSHKDSPYHSCVLLCKYVPCAPCKKRECPLKHHQCMKLITPEEVITHTINLLKNSTKGLNNDT